jgi:Zn-dependent protease with chaperone function
MATRTDRVPDRNAIRTLRETTPRFVLAILALLIAAIAVAESLWYWFYPEQMFHVTVELCAKGDQVRCLAETRSRIIWTVMIVPVAMAAALAVAAISSVIRRSRLRPLDNQVSASLSAACAAGLGIPPAPLLWRTDRPVSTARADGMLRRYIEVGPQWLTWAWADPARAAAILRHEYAHHRSRDVVVARTTIALSIIVTVLAIVLFAHSLEPFRPATSSTIALRSAAILLVAALARSSVLRAREFDADAQSAAHDNDGLRRALSTTTPDPPKYRWRTLLAHHPSASQRLAMVERPLLLHQPRIGDALLVGLSASVGAPVLSRLLSEWVGSGDLHLYSSAIAWAAMGIPISCWLVVTAWNRASIDVTDDGTYNPMAFSAALGIAVIAGTVLFSGGMVDHSVAVPHHPVDIASGILLATGIPIGAVWISQLLGCVNKSAATPRSLFRGWGAAAGLLSVVMMASLLGALSYVHHSAVLSTAFTSTTKLGSINVNSPLELVGVARTWNAGFPGLLLPLAATFGAIIVVTTSAALRRPIMLLSSAVIAAGAGLCAFWTLRNHFDIVQRATAAGWFAAGQVVNLLGGAVGLAVAVVAAVAVARLPGARTVVAGGLAVAGSMLACLAISAILPGPSAVWTLAGDVVPVSVLAAMLTAALLGDRRLGRGSLAGVAGLGAAAVAAVIALCVHVSSSSVSAEVDRNHYAQIVALEFSTDGTSMNGRLAQALQLCSGPVRPGSAETVSALLESYRGTVFMPATVELRSLHGELLDGLQYCYDALVQAQSAGRSSLTSAQAAKPDWVLGAYVRSVKELLDKAVQAGLTLW